MACCLFARSGCASDGAWWAVRPPQVTLEYRGPVFYAGASQTVSKGDRLMHGARGDVVGPATSEAYEGKGVSALFRGSTDCINCYLGTLSRTVVTSSDLVEVHTGFSCDASGMNPIVGPRFRRGENYDVCEAEFLKLDAAARGAFVRCAPPPTAVPGDFCVGDRVVYTGASQTFPNGDRIEQGGEGEVVGPAVSEDEGVAVLFLGNTGSIECHLTMLNRMASSDDAVRVAAKASPERDDMVAWLEAAKSSGFTGLTVLYDLTAGGAEAPWTDHARGDLAAWLGRTFRRKGQSRRVSLYDLTTRAAARAAKWRSGGLEPETRSVGEDETFVRGPDDPLARLCAAEEKADKKAVRKDVAAERRV